MGLYDIIIRFWRASDTSCCQLLRFALLWLSFKLLLFCFILSDSRVIPSDGSSLTCRGKSAKRLCLASSSSVLSRSQALGWAELTGSVEKWRLSEIAKFASEQPAITVALEISASVLRSEAHRRTTFFLKIIFKKTHQG